MIVHIYVTRHDVQVNAHHLTSAPKVLISHLIIKRLVKRNILLMYKTLMLFQLPAINLICHTNSLQGLYSLSMPSLEKGDAMSRGFKQHTAKQALIPKIYLKTILDLNFFLGIMLARVKHRSWIRNCICVNPKIWGYYLFQLEL